MRLLTILIPVLLATLVGSSILSIIMQNFQGLLHALNA